MVLSVIWLALMMPGVLLGQPNDILRQGHQAFRARNYSQALALYRQHLRRQPNDTAAWNLVAATYYHLGQPRRALVLLNHSPADAPNRSQNLFYQGLAHDAIENIDAARRYLSMASRYRDEYGELAIFELLALEADLRNRSQALIWARRYRRRFPNGAHGAQVKQVSQQLRRGEAVNITNSQRSLYQTGTYLYHPWSLTKIPHFWQLDIGYDYAQGTRTNPAIDDNRRPTVEEGAGFEESSLRVKAAFGFGPLKNKETTLFLGYYYLQDWVTTRERIEIFLDEPTDFNYFPFRPDLQERTHRLFADLNSKFNPSWSIGLYSELEFVRAGSSLYPAPERPEIRQSSAVSHATRLIPWGQWTWSRGQRLLFYANFSKHIDQEQSDFSNQTYQLFESGDPFFSPAVAYIGDLWHNRLQIRADLFRFHYLYNDYWEEHYQTGLFAKAYYKWSHKFGIFARLGYYIDDYLYDQIKTNSCSFDVQLGSFNDRGVQCPRTDYGNLLAGGLTYSPEPNFLWRFFVSYLSHQNPDLKVYNEKKAEFVLSFSMGFPNTRENLHLLNRFTETSLDYEGL
jgi:tetratricopeptide (TPR) repeat protein